MAPHPEPDAAHLNSATGKLGTRMENDDPPAFDSASGSDKRSVRGRPPRIRQGAAAPLGDLGRGNFEFNGDLRALRSTKKEIAA